MLQKKADDLQLLPESPRGAAGAGGLNRQMERRGAALLQHAVGSGTLRKQLTDGGDASRANRPMKRRGAPAVATVDLGSMLHQGFDQ
jgi:hypothetical protein